MSEIDAVAIRVTAETHQNNKNSDSLHGSRLSCHGSNLAIPDLVEPESSDSDDEEC